MGRMIKFVSSDGWELSAPKEVACRSLLIKSMLETVQDDVDEPISLSKVSGFILEKVLEYATEHKDDPPYEADNDYKPKNCDDISEWDRQFMDVDQGTLFELVQAANYLNIGSLLDLGEFLFLSFSLAIEPDINENLGCKVIAKMIKGKSVEEMRKVSPIHLGAICGWTSSLTRS